MNNKGLAVLIFLALAVGSYFIYTHGRLDPRPVDYSAPVTLQETTDPVAVSPVTHASFVMTWGDQTIYNDPTGGAALYEGQAKPTIVLVSDIHGDHLDAPTLQGVLTPDAKLIAPQAVIDMLPADLKARATKLANGEKLDVNGISIEAVPMYNLPESKDSRHTKGRGNGYVLSKGDFRVYVAGDTSATPEMKALRGIDLAFIPMNPPYTMTVDEAAAAVLEFVPSKVYPYHYRTPEGLSDVAKFQDLLKSNPGIEVVLENWYPENPAEVAPKAGEPTRKDE